MVILNSLTWQTFQWHLSTPLVAVTRFRRKSRRLEHHQKVAEDKGRVNVILLSTGILSGEHLVCSIWNCLTGQCCAKQDEGTRQEGATWQDDWEIVKLGYFEQGFWGSFPHVSIWDTILWNCCYIATWEAVAGGWPQGERGWGVEWDDQGLHPCHLSREQCWLLGSDNLSC